MYNIFFYRKLKIIPKREKSLFLIDIILVIDKFITICIRMDITQEYTDYIIASIIKDKPKSLEKKSSSNTSTITTPIYDKGDKLFTLNPLYAGIITASKFIVS